MTAIEEQLHMLDLEIEARHLHGIARDRRLPLHAVDLGYLIHCHLRELFGDLAPTQFTVSKSEGKWVRALAYARHDGSALEATARTFAPPAAYAACRWPLPSKPMPTTWPSGAHLGFQARVCPVVRKSGDGPRHRRGAEVDVFLDHCWQQEDPAIPVDREAVYRDWLAAELARNRAATLAVGRLEGFQIGRLLRRTQGTERRSAIVERPDALMAGELVVDDGPAFGQLLQRGLGRHRAFGFGMLLLRHPGLR